MRERENGEGRKHTLWVGGSAKKDDTIRGDEHMTVGWYE